MTPLVGHSLLSTSKYISKALVSFRYQLRYLCSMPSCSGSLRYHLVPRHDISSRTVLFRYQWNVSIPMSQKGASYWRISCDIVMTSQHDPRRPDLYELKMRCCHDVICRVDKFYYYPCIYILMKEWNKKLKSLANKSQVDTARDIVDKKWEKKFFFLICKKIFKKTCTLVMMDHNSFQYFNHFFILSECQLVIMKQS